MNEYSAHCKECGAPLLIEAVLHEDGVVVLYINPCEDCLHRIFIEEYRETLSDKERRQDGHQ